MAKHSLDEMLEIARDWMDEHPTTPGPAEDFIRDFAGCVEELLDKQGKLITKITILLHDLEGR